MADGGGTHQNQMMQTLLEQNRRLLGLLGRKPEAFHVMPDLNKAVHDFHGEGSSHESGAWLKSTDSMAVLHGWPDSFRLENAKLHMKGPARFWLQTRVDDLTTWKDFKIAFRKTFVGQIRTAEKWKQMQERVQMRGKSITAYFLENTLLCKRLCLCMQDTKEQVLVGLQFRDACISMTAKERKDEDELLAHLQRMERMSEARMQKSPGAKPQGGDPGATTPRAKPPTSRSWTIARPRKQVITNACATDQTSGGGQPKKTPEPPKRDKAERKCYSCERNGHIARDCPKTNPVGNFVLNENPTSGSGPSKFLKTATINGTRQLSVMTDQGNSNCILRPQAAEKCSLQVVCRAQQLYGFGNTAHLQFVLSGPRR
ncbi:uncharacterized protein [Dermacentor andersoni]|uniref:uncharacterized protein n=1 Tax=Dermacentor andersoni TaxID=34620 RepID=UPI003B3BE744